MIEYCIQFDGSCFPNPGSKAGWGYTVIKNGITFAQNFGKCSGKTVYSNNYAEFQAIYEALKEMKLHVQETDRLVIQGDSQLVINMLRRNSKGNEFKIYYPQFILAKKVLKDIINLSVIVSFNWVPRELNKKADELSTAYKL